ncbi:DUF4838 domain-containing protein [Niabella beijingensis]|uniref:DUF4838 domain-containing protein n=1 Tax=Niabella beijingensis TaxID=2872700 RepID=UPI001CBB9500|nr:DUF4838 domain-containing protein [Niabella beijingensis]MBZ4191517.1 DUF4838 domain-containing protein [Niabella beijingensis]
MYKKIKILAFIVLLAMFGNANPIVIVKDGRPNAEIILKKEDYSNLRDIADTLSKYIFQSTFAQLNVLTAPANYKNQIVIGIRYGEDQKFFNYSNLDEDGFVIIVRNDKVVISGNTKTGIEYGVYQFLERFLGILWLSPGSLWTDIPKQANLVINETNVIENPEFLTRYLSPAYLYDNYDLSEWAKKNYIRKRVEYSHNMYKLFRPSSLKKESNLEFFPAFNGKKYIPKDDNDQAWQPNFTAKGSEKYAAQKIKDFFTQNPNVTTYSFGTNDSQNFDTSYFKGNKNEMGYNNYSDTYYRWVNATVEILNRSFSNKSYGLIAHYNTATPPGFNLKDNIIPFLTFERLKWIDNKSKNYDISNTKKWLKTSKQIGWYDYVYGRTYLTPRTDFELIATYLKSAREMGVRHYVAESYPNILEGPKIWFITKLLWNPHQDFKQLLNTWYERAVGKNSAIHLKQFYDIWGKFWTKDIQNTRWWNTNGTYLNFFDYSYIYEIPYAYVKNSDELLNKVLSNADNDIHKKRAAELLKFWNFTKLNYMYIRQNPRTSLDIDNEIMKTKRVSQNEIMQAKNNLLGNFNSIYLKYMNSLDLYSFESQIQKASNISKANNLLDSKGSISGNPIHYKWFTWKSNNSTGSIKLSKNGVNVTNMKSGAIYQLMPYSGNGVYIVSFNFNRIQYTSGTIEVELKISTQNKTVIKNKFPTIYHIDLNKLTTNQLTCQFKMEPQDKMASVENITLQINFKNEGQPEVILQNIKLAKSNSSN